MLKSFASIILGTITVLGAGLSTDAEAVATSQISQVYFFGDSLTDSGFNDNLVVALPLNKAPTFTTLGGYTWAQYVARDLKGYTLPVYVGHTANPADTITNNYIYHGASPSPTVSGNLNGIDYAAAGATTNSTGNGLTAPSLRQQVSYFLASNNNSLDPNAIYFVWAGANDLLTLLTSNPTQLQLLIAANTAAVNIGYDVARLSAAGAKRIVVMSLPNIGITPYVAFLSKVGNVPTLPASLKSLTFTFNSMLNTQLGQVVQQYGTKILYVDVYDLLNNVVIAIQNNQPFSIAGKNFTFVNYTSPACGSITTSAVMCPSTAPNNYLFADAVHPTDLAHQTLATLVESQVLTWQ